MTEKRKTNRFIWREIKVKYLKHTHVKILE